MAVLHYKSTLISNAEALPPVLSLQTQDGGRMREKCATVEVVNGDSAASTYRFFRVKSSSRVCDLILDADDIGTTTTADIGLYDTLANGAAVVDADFFASAVVLNAAVQQHTNVTRESGIVDFINRNKRVWEQLGLTADPNKEYEVAATLVGAADGGGTLTLTLRYQDGN